MVQKSIIVLNVKRIVIKTNMEFANAILIMYGTCLMRSALLYLMTDVLIKPTMMSMADAGLVEEDVMFAMTMKMSIAMNVEINLDGKNLL